MDFPIYADTRNPDPRPPNCTPAKAEAERFLAARVIYMVHKSVMSLGSGIGIYEAQLQKDTGARVVAVERDWRLVREGGWRYPNITLKTFDFRKQLGELFFLIAGHGPIDLAYFMDSSYVLTAGEFTRLLGILGTAGVREVVDLSTAVIPVAGIPRTLLGIAKQEAMPWRFRPQGYARTQAGFRRIYRAAGWEAKEETALGNYGHVAVLRRGDRQWYD
jgi:hypothetical protein